MNNIRVGKILNKINKIFKNDKDFISVKHDETSYDGFSNSFGITVLTGETRSIKEDYGIGSEDDSYLEEFDYFIFIDTDIKIRDITQEFIDRKMEENISDLFS